MKKRKSIGLWVGICLLLLGILGSVNVLAAVTEGKAGETLTGEYAVIINTDTSDSRSAGTLIFDDSGRSCQKKRKNKGRNLRIRRKKQWQR